MKNFIIGFSMVCLILAVSLIYKDSKKQILDRFPNAEPADQTPGDQPRLYLYLFFLFFYCSECKEKRKKGTGQFPASLASLNKI
ncbi:MAG: hypothetical protein GY765_16935 [bacterium]|nr:hypothetical protein [bacterium]